MTGGSGWPSRSLRFAYLPDARSASMMPRKKLDEGRVAVLLLLGSVLMSLILENAWIGGLKPFYRSTGHSRLGGGLSVCHLICYGVIAALQRFLRRQLWSCRMFATLLQLNKQFFQYFRQFSALETSLIQHVKTCFRFVWRLSLREDFWWLTWLGFSYEQFSNC